MINNFSKLNLEKDFIKNLNSLEYKEMTKIQELALPHVLENKDIIAKAKTGSGKTAAFGIGLLNKLDVKSFRIQSLVLAPTRELANQVANELRKLARFKHNIKILTLCGGVPYKPQAHSLSHGAHIIVGTPGRVLKHLNEETLNLKNVNTLVLDEADRMLDMGFSEDIFKILDLTPKNRQSLLFSATYEDEVLALSKKVLNNPIEVSVEDIHKKEIIRQEFFKLEENRKLDTLHKILNKEKPKSTLIFCNTKIKCEELGDDLYERGIDLLTLHSDLEQKERDEVLTLFSNKSYPLLIATDVAARGLDIDDIELVINYDLAKDVAVHTHRIGRTARAGKSGLAISFYEGYEDSFEEIEEKFNDIEFSDFNSLSGIDTDEIKIDSEFRALYINGGKRHKLRAGDIVGALTAGIGLDKNVIGNITIFPTHSYVAIKKEFIKKAKDGLGRGKMKGRYFKVYDR